VLVQDACIEVREKLWLVPADVDLATVEPELAEHPYRLSRLLDRFAISDLPYELVLVDNPPHIGLLTFNALLASREAIVPLDAGRFSWAALERFRETLAMLERERGHHVDLHLVANGFDLRTRFAREMLERLDTEFPEERLQTLIHPTIRLREAARAGQPIDVYDEGSKGAQDFDALAAEVRALIVERVSEETTREKVGCGPHPKPRRVEFVASFPGAARVAVTGDFTDWSVEGRELSRRPDGRWRLDLPVGAGVHEYKYIVDGAWKVDPDNPERVQNDFGQLNSVVVVPAEPDDIGRTEARPER
jgi:cellulose biosynthesis protein BcsQ